MIYFSGTEADTQSLLSKYPDGSAEYEALEKLLRSDERYVYGSEEELIFEISMRRYIIDASLALYRGRLAFRIFRKSFCNEAFWERAANGGFVLKRGAVPSEAIRDIFRNTRKYGTECATAIVMIYYKAVLDAYPENLFNTSFTTITLMNWQQMSELIGVATYRGLADYIPGDCRYFRNPDVNPLTPEWQGENAIDLGGGRYYGHGVGIGGSDRIIAILNENRADGSEVSAYLMDTATRPDFKRLYRHLQQA